MSKERVLLIDPDPRAWGDLPERLEALGLEVALETAADRATTRIGAQRWDVLLAEVELLGRGVLELARSSPGAPDVLLLDTFGDEHDGAAAMSAGAFGVLPRPASSDQCLVSVQRALEKRRTAAENRDLRERIDRAGGLGDLATRDPALERTLDLVRSVADTRVTLLVQGESGTGKTLLARALHDHSPRARAPFVVVNCGALPDALLESELFGHVKGAFTGATADRIGRFEAADGGTLFLDEINSASLDLQVKLLRAIESGEFEPLGGRATRKVDVRLVAAANEDLRTLAASGRFRDDLYWRLAVVEVALPPLRERKIDVPFLAARFLAASAREHQRPARHLSSAALERLLAHDWPGNVRELRHTLERAVLLAAGETIEPVHLPSDVGARSPEPVGAAARRSDAPSAAGSEQPADAPSHAPSHAPSAGDFDGVPLGPLREMLARPERRFVERALIATGGSRSRTAQLLDVNRGTLFNKMRRYGLMSFPRGPGAAREEIP
jgi:DNA-binding NtrC family response regulator